MFLGFAFTRLFFTYSPVVILATCKSMQGLPVLRRTDSFFYDDYELDAERTTTISSTTQEPTSREAFFSDVFDDAHDAFSDAGSDTGSRLLLSDVRGFFSNVRARLNDDEADTESDTESDDSDEDTQPVRIARRRPFRDLYDNRFIGGFRLGHFGLDQDTMPGDNVNLREEESNEEDRRLK